jgi:hypothetical protein
LLNWSDRNAEIPTKSSKIFSYKESLDIVYNAYNKFSPTLAILIDKITLESRSETYLLKQIDDALHSLNFKWELRLFDHALKYIPDSKFLLSKALFGYLFLNYGSKALPLIDQHLKYYNDDFRELMLLLFFYMIRDISHRLSTI